MASCQASNIRLLLSSIRAEGVDLPLQQPKDQGGQIAVGHGVVQPHAHRHHQPAVLLPVPAPVHDGREVQVAVGPLDGAASNYNDGKTEFKYIDTPIAECSLVIVTRADDADLCSRIAEEYVSMAQQGKIKELCQSYDLNVLLSSAIKNNPEEAST